MVRKGFNPKKVLKPYMNSLILGAVIIASGVGIGLSVVNITSSST